MTTASPGKRSLRKLTRCHLGNAWHRFRKHHSSCLCQLSDYGPRCSLSSQMSMGVEGVNEEGWWGQGGPRMETARIPDPKDLPHSFLSSCSCNACLVHRSLTYHHQSHYCDDLWFSPPLSAPLGSDPSSTAESSSTAPGSQHLVKCLF